jgi:hypothetical protein
MDVPGPYRKGAVRSLGVAPCFGREESREEAAKSSGVAPSLGRERREEATKSSGVAPCFSRGSWTSVQRKSLRS